MAGRVSVQLVAWLFLTVLPVNGSPSSHTLVSYSFDDGSLETGPDTFAVFAHAKGTVSLTQNFRFSGYSSVEIRDVAGDKDFPELQGYFIRRDHGLLFVHFAFLTTDPQQELNIALAGPQWFVLRKNGIAFWIKTEEGFLYHVSDSIPKRLFRVTPFVWYLVDIRYDIGAGTYDLTVHEENKPRPIITLLSQKNAPNQPGSEVDKFSFIGDAGEDTSNVVYYVDDVIVSVDETVTQLPFIAPGRRKLFVDSWNDSLKLASQKPNYLPVVALSDFGISHREALALQQADAMKLIGGLIAGKRLSWHSLEKLTPDNTRILQAMDLWNSGRQRLNDGEPTEALALFEDALAKVPSGKIYDLYVVLALISLRRWQEVDLRLGELSAMMQGDPRFGVVSAMVGLARANLDEAERWLSKPAEETPEKFSSESVRKIWSGPITPGLIKEIRDQYPDSWLELIEEPQITQQYFFVLLWKNRFAEAEQYAWRMAERIQKLKMEPTIWLERAGDSAFLAGNVSGALRWYEASYGDGNPTSRVLLKLSDVYFRLGDQDQERLYRERIYGSLAGR